MTEIHLDTEFCEHDRLYDPISIGMVDDKGNEYYAIFRDMPFAHIQKNPWLVDNVMKYLPVRMGHGDPWDRDHPDFVHVKPMAQIADEVKHFVLSKHMPDLWGWYAAHDHVVTTQLFGTFLDLPVGWPWMDDIRQEWKRAGYPRLPEQLHGEHNALEDAKFNQTRLWAIRQWTARRA